MKWAGIRAEAHRSSGGGGGDGVDVGEGGEGAVGADGGPEGPREGRRREEEPRRIQQPCRPRSPLRDGPLAFGGGGEALTPPPKGCVFLKNHASRRNMFGMHNQGLECCKKKYGC